MASPDTTAEETTGSRDSVTIPDFCLVLLVGASGAGKSTFARRHFRPTEIVSSDACRGMISDDEADQSVSPAAFALVAFIAEKRLAARRLTVIDATNLKPADRAPLRALAKKYHASVIAFVLQTDQATCLAHNRQRRGRTVAETVITAHQAALRRGLGSLKQHESVKAIHTFASVAEINALKVIRRMPLSADRRDETGPFDIIGDVHGCAGELELLLEELGYDVERDGVEGQRTCQVTPPAGRRALFVGDLVDRGPRSPDVLRLVKHMLDAGTALCIMGNHEAKLIGKLAGRDVKLGHGLAETMAQFATQPDGFGDATLDWIRHLPTHMVLDGGALVVAHAGLPEAMHNRDSGKVHHFALYGQTTGKTDEFGLPVRADWAAGYRGQATVVHGHTPLADIRQLNRVICIDTGCVFGGRLTAFRWPEQDFVSVAALQQWSAPVKPL
ncbi:MAG: AAA family ATPase [Minwuia sp.]|nr:AAA family ATPase [Minwuia sp.]